MTLRNFVWIVGEIRRYHKLAPFALWGGGIFSDRDLSTIDGTVKCDSQDTLLNDVFDTTWISTQNEFHD
jgi:hypothetical protein